MLHFVYLSFFLRLLSCSEFTCILHEIKGQINIKYNKWTSWGSYKKGGLHLDHMLYNPQWLSQHG